MFLIFFSLKIYFCWIFEQNSAFPDKKSAIIIHHGQVPMTLVSRMWYQYIPIQVSYWDHYFLEKYFANTSYYLILWYWCWYRVIRILSKILFSIGLIIQFVRRNRDQQIFRMRCRPNWWWYNWILNVFCPSLICLLCLVHRNSNHPLVYFLLPHHWDRKWQYP